MSARSTGMFSLMHRYCCFTREPHLCSRLKLTPPELSVAEYSFTGIDTKPKLSESDAIERAAMRGSCVLENRAVSLARTQRFDTFGGLKPSAFIAAMRLCRDVQ